jgi:hypothetical protein
MNIKNIIDILNTNEHYNVSQNVEIAKGKYEYVTTWKQAWYKIKRHWNYGRKD